MSAKLVVLYGAPDDPDAFLARYRAEHVPLVDKIPGVDKFEWLTVAAAADGGEQSYSVIAELSFADPDALQTAMGTDEGKAAAAHYGEIAPSGSRMFVTLVN
jgi:uncharacterized protein (TIGR02118 family)